jgi:hypothetical protein
VVRGVSLAKAGKIDGDIREGFVVHHVDSHGLACCA